MNLPVKICTSLLATLFLFASLGGNAAHAQANDDLAGALKKYDYPWYDADTDQLKPIKEKNEAFPISLGRNAIELGKAKTPKKKTPPTPPAGGAAKTVGNGWFGDFDLAQLFMIILVTVIVCALAFLFYKFLAVESSEEDAGSTRTVSYTHLTLPTICSV